jgi:hypothetical protein
MRKLSFSHLATWTGETNSNGEGALSKKIKKTDYRSALPERKQSSAKIGLGSVSALDAPSPQPHLIPLFLFLISSQTLELYKI